MDDTVFFKMEFFALILCSLVIPVMIYIYLMWADSISREAIGWYGLAFIILATADVLLLRRLRGMALDTPSLLDDKVFASELTTALYVLPVFFAGIGVNLISHVLIEHLKEAEGRRDKQRQALARDHEGGTVLIEHR